LESAHGDEEKKAKKAEKKQKLKGDTCVKRGDF